MPSLSFFLLVVLLTIASVTAFEAVRFKGEKAVVNKAVKPTPCVRGGYNYLAGGCVGVIVDGVCCASIQFPEGCIPGIYDETNGGCQGFFVDTFCCDPSSTIQAPSNGCVDKQFNKLDGTNKY